jgi:hypothetical protein
LQQLFYELKYAISQLSKEDLSKLFLESAKIASLATYNSKRKAVENVYDFSTFTFNRYKKNGIIFSLKNDGNKLWHFINSLPAKTKEIYSDFIVAPREKQVEIVAVTILTLTIFYLSAGGFDLEGGLPDSDIAILGIGKHRNYFSHSILIGLGVEFTGRFGILTLNQIKSNLPNPHHKSWELVYGFIDRNKELAIAAMWLGIGCHLLKDSGLITGGVKPYSDLPFSMPMEAHQGMFAANGIASTIFSTNMK